MQKKVDQNNNKQTESEKTWTKFSLLREGIKYGFGFENEKFSGSAAKTLLDEKDWKIAAVLSGEIKPAKGE